MDQLKNKWLLLDANVVIEQSLHHEDPFWIAFEARLSELSCQAIVVPEIQFELFRRIRSSQDEENLLSFLDRLKISRLVLPNSGAWQRASRIGQLYALAKLDGISAIDCILAAYLQQHPKSLYLATFNNRDFPLNLFDRHHMLNFEIKNEIKVLGIYSFSEKKFGGLMERFEKAKSPKK